MTPLKFIQLTSGFNHSLGLREDHVLFGFGDNFYGQLGLPGVSQLTEGKTINISTLTNDELIIQTSCGFSHSIVLTNKGRVFVSGNNKFQQLGLPQFKQLDQFTELSFEGLLSYEEKIIKIGAGYYHSAALTNQGQVFMWGKDTTGQVGVLADLPVQRPVSMNIFDLSAKEIIKDMSVGWEHNIAKTSEDRIFEWGVNEYRRSLTEEALHELPEMATEIFFEDSRDDEKIKTIIASSSFSIVLSNHHRSFLWGSNSENQLGYKELIPRSRTKPISINWQNPIFKFAGLKTQEHFVDIASNGPRVMALTNHGTLVAWGEKDNLPLRRFFPFLERYLPFIHSVRLTIPKLLKNEKIVSLSAGYRSFFFLTDQGRIWTVGPAKVYALDERFKHFTYHSDDFSFGCLKMPY
jgi:alpha-tubulin suppressor-like RCC1 family protein